MHGWVRITLQWLPAHILSAVFLERYQRLLGPCHKVATGLAARPCVGLSFFIWKRQTVGRAMLTMLPCSETMWFLTGEVWGSPGKRGSTSQ